MRPPTDLRRNQKQTERRLLILAVVVLVFVGGGLIALIYGPGAWLTALPCLLGGAGAILFLYLLFTLAERWVNR
jgi:protein-S-isoprenylcysteine O-methyltransferase Ste14